MLLPPNQEKEVMMMKKILFLGAGFLESFVIQKARKLGYYVIAIDGRKNAGGFKYANQAIVMNVTNIDGCLAIALIHKISGVIAPADKEASLTAAYIAEQMNLPSVGFETVRSTTNKYYIREILMQHQIDDRQQYYRINQLKDLQFFADYIQFPVTVDTNDLSQCDPPRKVETMSELTRFCESIFKTFNDKEVIVQDYINGHEFLVEVFVYQGKVFILGIIEKLFNRSVEEKELGYALPSKLKREQQLKDMVIAALEVLELDFGAVTLDIILTPAQQFYIVNISTTIGPHLAGSHVIPKAMRYDYLGNLIRATVNEGVELPPHHLIKNVATRILLLEPGAMVQLGTLTEFEKQHRVTLIVNQERHQDYCLVISVEDSLIVAQENAEKAMQDLQKLLAARPFALSPAI